MEDSFSTDWELEIVVSRRFKHIAFIVHFISITFTSVPPQILEAGDPCT